MIEGVAKGHVHFMELVVSTRNPQKLEEIRRVLDEFSIRVVGLDGFPSVVEIVEDGRTFAENAIKKAVTVALAVKRWVLADDSGLEVFALGGAPGVLSARFAGEPVSYQANNQKLLRLLEGVQDRRARFRCVIALSSPSGRYRTVEGTCEGTIIHECRGTGGFGYDPLFVPEGHSSTFAELPPSVKDSLSHRGRALRKAVEAWGPFLATNPTDWPE